MSNSNCCLLTWIQISQEAAQVVWYPHLFQTFPQFVVIHTAKGSDIVNKADVFLKLSSFFDDLVFPILLFLSISLCWSLRKTFLSLLAILWNSAFKWVHFSVSLLPFASLLYSVICKAYSDNHFAFLHFFPPLGMVMITASSTVLWTSVHSSLGTLLDLIPWIYLSLPVYNNKGVDLGHAWNV